METKIATDLDHLLSFKQLFNFSLLSLLFGLLPLFGLIGWQYLNDLLLVWIPASFLLFALWTVMSIKGTPKLVNNVPKTKKVMNFFTKDMTYLWDFILLSYLPLLKGVAVIFLVNIPLIFYLEKATELWIPLISSILIVLGCIIGFNELRKYYGKTKPSILNNSNQILQILVVMVLIILIGASIIFYLISLWHSFGLVTDYLMLGITMVVQLVSLFFTASYASARQAEDIINFQINQLSTLRERLKFYSLTKQTVDNKKTEELFNSYMAINRFGVKIGYLYYFFKFYQISFSPGYLFHKGIATEDTKLPK